MARSTRRVKILLPADEVDDPLVDRIVEQAVDGEVAALGVLRGRAERDAVGMPAVAVGGVVAERGHLDLPGRLAARGR